MEEEGSEDDPPHAQDNWWCLCANRTATKIAATKKNYFFDRTGALMYQKV